MSYAVKEIVYTLQGEGAQTGRPAVFCRFTGCNLWSGREADRSTAICQFCDTDFVGTNGVGGGTFADAVCLARTLRDTWNRGVSAAGGSPIFSVGQPAGVPFVVFTGGEPLLQMDAALIDAVHTQGFEIAVETNGTLPVPRGVDWLCVSPKQGSDCLVHSGDELKLVGPQPGLDPQDLTGWNFQYFFLQPMDGPHRAEHTRWAVAYCLAHPQWRLSLQTHKFLGLP